MNRLGRILLVEDSVEDIQFIQINLKKENILNPLDLVKDGAEAIDYAKGVGEYQDRELPVLVLLDIDLPKYNGLEVLREFKQMDQFKRIPVIILTTSIRDSDVSAAYMLGVSGYIPKPDSIEDMRKILRIIKEYWLEITVLPEKEG